MEIKDLGRIDAEAPTGLSPSVEPVPVSPVPASIPCDGSASLRKLGLDYYYDPEDWEITCDTDDLEQAEEWLADAAGYGKGVREIATLIAGPTLFAGHYPISWVDDSDPGDIDDWEVRFYESHDHWRRAVTSAMEARRAETGTGSVHDSAVRGSEDELTHCNSSNSPNQQEEDNG